MKYILILICLFFSSLISAQPSLKELRHKEEMTCPHRQTGSKILTFSTTLQDLKFIVDTSRYEISKIDTSTNVYILTIKYKPASADKSFFLLTISGKRYKSYPFDVQIGKCYEIYEVGTIPGIIRNAFHSRNNYISLEGKWMSLYNRQNIDYGLALTYRIGKKVGWGIQVGVYNYKTKCEHSGTLVIGNISKVISYLHGSFGLNCYPLLWFNKWKDNKPLQSLAQNLHFGISYPTLVTQKYEAYNDKDGNYSFGGTRIMSGISIILGEEYLFPLGRSPIGLIVRGGGKAYCVNLNKIDWKFAYEIDFGICYKLNRI